MLVGEKNPNKQNTKYIYLETVKKASLFFYIVFFCEQTYDLPRCGGGAFLPLSFSFWLKWTGVPYPRSQCPLHSLTAQTSLRQLCVAAQTTPEAEERREIG